MIENRVKGRRVNSTGRQPIQSWNMIDALSVFSDVIKRTIANDVEVNYFEFESHPNLLFFEVQIGLKDFERSFNDMDVSVTEVGGCDRLFVRYEHDLVAVEIYALRNISPAERLVRTVGKDKSLAVKVAKRAADRINSGHEVNWRELIRESEGDA